MVFIWGTFGGVQTEQVGVFNTSVRILWLKDLYARGMYLFNEHILEAFRLLMTTSCAALSLFHDISIIVAQLFIARTHSRRASSVRIDI